MPRNFVYPIAYDAGALISPNLPQLRMTFMLLRLYESDLTPCWRECLWLRIQHAAGLLVYLAALLPCWC